MGKGLIMSNTQNKTWSISFHNPVYGNVLLAFAKNATQEQAEEKAARIARTHELDLNRMFVVAEGK